MTNAYIRAADVYEAARLTHNRIVADEHKIADDMTQRYREMRLRWSWLYDPLTEREAIAYRQDILDNYRPARKFHAQKMRCVSIMALAEGARRADKEAHMQVDLETIDIIDIGWNDMVRAERGQAAQSKPSVTLAKYPEPAGGALLSTDTKKSLLKEGG